MRLRLIQRFYNYEKLLMKVTISLINGETVTGTMAKVHWDFLTIMNKSKGAVDIPFTSIVAISPVTQKKRKGKG